MNATLSSIDAGIFTALEALKTDRGGHFSTVMRLVVSEARQQDKELSRAAGTCPALILALEIEAYEELESSALLGEFSFVGTSTWRVYIVNTDASDHEEVVTGHVGGEPGMMELVSVTVKTLSGLAIPNLHQSSRLRPVDVKPVHVKPGEFVYMARFRAERFIDGVAIVDTSQPFEGVTGDMHLVEETDVPDPINSFDVSVETE